MPGGLPGGMLKLRFDQYIIKNSDLQIQNYKNEVQLKLKLHQLRRITLRLSRLQLSDFLKILTGARISFLCNSF